MSNSARKFSSSVSAFQTITLFLGIGALVAFAAFIGGMFLASLSGAIIGLTIGRIVESRRVGVGAAVSGIVSGAVTALLIPAMGEGIVSLAVGAVVFDVVGYVLWFLGASWFQLNRSA